MSTLRPATPVNQVSFAVPLHMREEKLSDCKVQMDGTDHYACTWTSCLKYRKEGK